MRLLLVLCVSASVLAVGGAARAEGTRYVRTSLDAAAEPQHPLPPRVIMATLDGTSTAELGTEIAPRSFRRSLEETPAPAAPAPAAPAPEGTPQSPSIAEFPPVDAAAIAAASVEAAPAAAEPAQVVPAAPKLDSSYGPLECDCTRSGRQIRVTLDESSEAPAQRPRVIRVQL